MSYEIIITPSFKKELNRINDKKHLNLIYKTIEKIRKYGETILKHLYTKDNYVLYEKKFKNPPYRLYVVKDKQENTFYIVSWEHKDKQPIIINKIKEKLKKGFISGFKYL